MFIYGKLQKDSFYNFQIPFRKSNSYMLHLKEIYLPQLNLQFFQDFYQPFQYILPWDCTRKLQCITVP